MGAEGTKDNGGGSHRITVNPSSALVLFATVSPTTSVSALLPTISVPNSIAALLAIILLSAISITDAVAVIRGKGDDRGGEEGRCEEKCDLHCCRWLLVVVVGGV